MQVSLNNALSIQYWFFYFIISYLEYKYSHFFSTSILLFSHTRLAFRRNINYNSNSKIKLQFLDKHATRSHPWITRGGLLTDGYEGQIAALNSFASYTSPFLFIPSHVNTRRGPDVVLIIY